MNEKIKQLAEQATTRKFDGTGTDMGKLVLDQEKFAELIVKECAKIADIADESKCEWIGGNILIHFGVEE
jgi:hypothetical protein